MAIDFPRMESPVAHAAAAAPAESLWTRLNRIQLTIGRIGAAERMLFTERLELLLETGLSLLDALTTLHQQTSEPRVAAILSALAATVGDGQSFSAALAQHPEMFPQTYVRLIAAAEEGSFLPQVLTQLREIDEKNSNIRSSLTGALAYPAFLIAFSLAVVIFVLVVIFPKFKDLFVSIKDQLPVPTRVLMFASDMLRDHWLILSIAGVAVVVGFLKWLQSPGGVRAIDELKLKTPLIGKIFVQVYVSQTLRVLAMSLSNGVPLTVALKASQDVVSNSVFAGFLERVLESVQQGRGIAAGFAEASFVPAMVRQMVATGEQSGNLAHVMHRIAEFYERELAKRIAAFAKAVEPVMLLVMGLVVGLIVAALILPIFKISRSVR
jgi:type II secretory pathway component PulF